MPIISDIVPQKKNKNYYSVFVDNKYLFSLSVSDLNFLHLKVNDTITEERLDNLIHIYSLQKAKDYAYRLISRKAYSEEALKEKLNNKFPENITIKVINDLKELNYINDKVFINDYVRNKIELKPMGPWKLKQDLTNKKFSEALVKEAIQKIFQEYDEFELALKVFNKKFKNINKTNDLKELNKIKNYLLSNGFNSNVVIRVINGVRP